MTHPLDGMLQVDYRGESRNYALLGDLFGLQYAHELELFSYGLTPIPLDVLSLLSLPPNLVAADLDARRFLVEAETLRVSPFGVTYMVNNSADYYLGCSFGELI